MPNNQQNRRTLSIQRRNLISGGLAAGAAMSLTAPTSAMPNHSLELPRSPFEIANITRKMRYRLDSGKVVWSFDGPAYSVVKGQLTPIYHLVHASIMEIEQKADGGMEALQYEIGFRTDIHTGERLESYLNPVTGERVKVPYAPVGPTLLKFDKHNNLDLPEFIGGSRFTLDHKPEVIQQLGDMLMLQYHSQALIETEDRPTKTKNDLGLIYGPAAEALSPTVKNAKAYIHSTDAGAYSNWLKMPEDFEGVQMLRAVGHKVESIMDLPQAWLKLAKKTDPDILKNPESIFTRKQIKFQN